MPEQSSTRLGPDVVTPKHPARTRAGKLTGSISGCPSGTLATRSVRSRQFPRMPHWRYGHEPDPLPRQIESSDPMLSAEVHARRDDRRPTKSAIGSMYPKPEAAGPTRQPIATPLKNSPH